MRKILMFALMCLFIPAASAADDGGRSRWGRRYARAGKLSRGTGETARLRGVAPRPRSSYSGYRPKLDVYAGVGRYNLDGDGYRYTLNNMYNHDYDGFSAVATQPVYDGNLTNSSVKRYKYAKNMRYFDLLSQWNRSATPPFVRIRRRPLP